jgi:putative Mn2+ efflux pump MntP
MTLDALFLLALGLSFDAFGASVSRGAAGGAVTPALQLQIAGMFGVFATAAPVAGWAVGLAFYDLIASVDHWVAFVLLGGVGIHMIREATGSGANRSGTAPDPVTPGHRLAVLAASAFATSVDAGVVGISLPALRVNVVLAAGVIGTVTFVASLVGLRLGRAGGAAFGPKAEIAGGVILIAMGAKILVEHLFF